jgi:hypothetical protein
MYVIGIGHRARHGKDTLANGIRHHLGLFGYHALVASFAHELKSLARALGMRGKNSVMLQHLGLAMRALDEDYWIKRLEDRIAQESEAPDVVIVPDVRFPNEARWVASRGGPRIKVSRLMPDGSLFVAQDRDPNHESETALADWHGWENDFTITDGDLDTLHRLGFEMATLTAQRLRRG